jgi:hypothetical protein
MVEIDGGFVNQKCGGSAMSASENLEPWFREKLELWFEIFLEPCIEFVSKHNSGKAGIMLRDMPEP